MTPFHQRVRIIFLHEKILPGRKIMRFAVRALLGITTLILSLNAGHSVSVKPESMLELERWVAAKFEEKVPGVTGEARIEVIANHDPVQLNQRGGKPMRLGNREFSKGLYCHANSRLNIVLPKAATRFEATVGIDSNEQTSGGKGSVTARLMTGEAVEWESDILREGMPPLEVVVNLGRVQEFSLVVNDGGDGISCDQFDWADARVTLEDGAVVWLGDLPLSPQTKGPFTNTLPFSFKFDGRRSQDLLRSWKIERTMLELDDNRRERTITYSDPDSGLVVRWFGIEYRDFPVIEWTLSFRNNGAEDTPILSDILAIDSRFERDSDAEYVLHHHTGDLCTADSYEPHQETLSSRKTRTIANTGGRPTQSAFPYFNISAGNEGMIFVVSWAGQWSSNFLRDEENGLTLQAGQEVTHLRLHPGEEIRTPMIVLMFWNGNVLESQNLWRQWMIVHNIPRPGGKLPPLPQLAACSSHQFGEMIHANRDNQIFFVDRYLEEKLRLDYWWMDAGWYINKTGWPNTGTWEVDTARFPGGLRAITDHIHEKGLKSLVWFEPERVTPGTWLYEQHPEWLLGKDGDQKLLNLGNPEARQWLTDHVDQLINEQGIDLYRQDFNMDPLGYWRDNDSGDRQGITENFHVQGYFAYWDELRKRHPDMLIDSCASGGRRNDLETLRRAVPLLRSDYIMEPVGNQCHTHALSLWFPFYGTGTSKTDAYQIWSVLCPHFIACWDMREKGLDYDLFRKILGIWLSIAPCYFGDYYPLTEYTLADDQWIAWQFHHPGRFEGFVQAFRRANSPYESARFQMKGLDPASKYQVWNSNQEGMENHFGAELMGSGVLVSLPEKASTVVIQYRVVK